MAIGDTIFGKNLSAGLGDTANRLSTSQSLDDAFNTRSNSPLERQDSIKDNFVRSNSSYSGSDVTVVIQINETLVVLGNLETFTYSILREKGPVRVLGRDHAKGYTSGGRTIAGSMVFVVFDEHPLYNVIKQINYVRKPSDRFTSPLSDQLPPLDLILLFNNEYGHSSIIRMYGVEFAQEGQVHSINDLYSENTMEYLCRDMDLMISNEKTKEFKDMLFERQTRGLFVNNQLSSILEYKRKLEREVESVNNIILQIDNELSRRTVAGAFTMGTAPLLAQFSQVLRTGDSTTRLDLRREKEKQLTKKSRLLTELDKANEQINLYEQNITGWNGTQNNQQYGTAGRNDLTATSKARLK